MFRDIKRSMGRTLKSKHCSLCTYIYLYFSFLLFWAIAQLSITFKAIEEVATCGFSSDSLLTLHNTRLYS